MKMNVTGTLNGVVAAPISKSDLHRLLIAAALCFGQTTTIHGYTMSEDIAATAGVLQAAGAKITFYDSSNTITVAGISPSFPCPVLADCRESGSTLRFLVPVLSALGFSSHFTGQGRLPQRPMTPLIGQLQGHGVVFSQEILPFTTTGQLQSGSYTFSGDVSSQYITGLLFALPLLAGDSTISLISPLQSQGYVDLTLSVLRRFGICVTVTGNVFHIPGSQRYATPGSLNAEGDWSNGAFWLTAGALGCPIAVEGLSLSSLQGDKEICAVLSRMGAGFSWENGRVKVHGGALRATTIDAAQIPDIIPVLAVAAAVAQGTTHIVNAGRLRIKESDRLAAMAGCLSRIGADVEEGPDSLTIHGKAQLQGGAVSSYNDHRIAMSMAVAALKCRGPVVIDQPMCVAKSYPNFYEEYKRLGGHANVVHMG